MKCIHCGREIPDYSQFCTYCGKKLLDEESATFAKKHTDGVSKSKKTKRTGKKALIIAAVGVMAMMLVFACIYTFTYLKAASYADEGDFLNAGESLLLPQLTHLHDEKLCAYIEAGLKLSIGEYDTAWEGFASLPGYKSADIMLMETDYQQAAQLLAANDFDGAEKKYSLLAAAGYKDSSVMVMECQCRRGLWLSEQGDYFGAYELLAALVGYAPAADGIEQLKERMYAEGQSLYRSGEYSEAERYFSFLAPYGDCEIYLTLIGAHMPSSVFYSEEMVRELILIIDFEDAAELLVSRSELADSFVIGSWATDDGLYYVESYYSGRSYLGCELNFLENTWHYYPAFTVKNGEVYFRDDLLFKITVVSPTCMSWYSYQNGNTYTLYKRI